MPNSVSALEKMPAPDATQERIVYKNPSERYMKHCLEFQDSGIGRNAAEFKLLLISALRDLSGEVDAALPLDILTCKEKTLSAFLRIQQWSCHIAELCDPVTVLYRQEMCFQRDPCFSISPRIIC